MLILMSKSICKNNCDFFSQLLEKLDNKENEILFYRLTNKSINNDRTFIAVMTCSDADKNCPYIPGAEKRISLKYYDPKEFDNTALEIKKYEECSYKIATEIFYVFSEVSKKI